MSRSAPSVWFWRFWYQAQSDIADHRYQTKCPLWWQGYQYNFSARSAMLSSKQHVLCTTTVSIVAQTLCNVLRILYGAPVIQVAFCYLIFSHSWYQNLVQYLQSRLTSNISRALGPHECSRFLRYSMSGHVTDAKPNQTFTMYTTPPSWCGFLVSEWTWPDVGISS
jgi:hypothetical protein